jgi:putative membrane protein
VVALIAQLIAFLVVRFLFMPKIVQRINDNELSAGIMLGGTSVAVGLLNAACMTY